MPRRLILRKSVLLCMPNSLAAANRLYRLRLSAFTMAMASVASSVWVKGSHVLESGGWGEKPLGRWRGLNGAGTAKDEGVLDDVFQFTDIAGIIVAHEKLKHRRHPRR